VLVGGLGDDQLYGGWGNDRLVGGSGADVLWGGVGRDRLVGGPGTNYISGGPGRDSISAANGSEDTIDCGTGRDVARVDRFDFVRGCERVLRKRKKQVGGTPEVKQQQPVEQLPECPGGGHACHEGNTGVEVLP
jgi:Ca2+-binding RTX toxin-like protein